MSELDLILTSLAVTLVGMTLAWVVCSRLRNVGLIDIFWGSGFAVIAVFSWTLTEHHTAAGGLAVLATCVWGLRLTIHLARRNIGQPEDYRYAEMRRRYGERFWWISLPLVFWLQGLLMWVIALPIQVGLASRIDWHPLRLCGFAVWLAGLAFEAIGDWQLMRFKSNPANRGQVMRGGLWRYTRHPNYFGDFLVWWGLYGMVVEPQSWWWTWVSPALMTFLLVRVSGVRLLEKSLSSRLDGYAEYVATTSPFLPMPPGWWPRIKPRRRSACESNRGSREES
ncbi:MAG: hypothetical protein KatS3mg111_1676 [Pirellulaceae bacterium]|nr:MAG: hypothetical protein KatS3mg111_1676 [Pirellulaceae bacterium]